MAEFFTFVVVGIVGGSTYALLALGLVLIHKVSRVLNMAQCSFGSLAAFVSASLAVGHGWPWWAAVLVGVLTGAAIGAATAWVLLGRSRGVLPPLVGTVALLAAITLVEARYLGGTRAFPTPVTGRGWDLAGVIVTPTRVLVVVVAAVAAVTLWVVVERTPLGLALRAGADNRVGASAVGLDPRRLEIAAWTAAGALGALAGVLAGWVPQTITPGFLVAVLPQAFAAALLAGMVSLPGAIAGGLTVGVAESLARLYWGGTPGSPELVVFALLAVVLVFRPRGLFSHRQRARRSVEGSESLVRLDPIVRDPRSRTPAGLLTGGGVAALVLVSTVVVAHSVSGPDAFDLSAVPAYIVLALSVDFLTASTGQLSLGQAGLFGLGAFGAAIASATWGLPPPLAFAAGPLFAGLAAALLGAASLRVRGLYLAVLTLAFAVVLQAFVFPTSPFSRGGAGLSVARPTVGPFDLRDDGTFLVASVLLLVAVWLALRHLERLPLLRAFVAVRENRTAAAARGIQPALQGIVAFTVSGVIAGLAGSTFAFRQGIVVASAFPVELSLTLVIWVVLGGLGSRPGVAATTAAFTLVGIYAAGSSDVVMLVAAVAVVLTIGRFPLGIAGWARAKVLRPLAGRVARRAATATAGRSEGAAPVTPALVIPRVRMADDSMRRLVLLGARDITLRFGGNLALDAVSLDVYPGEIVGILGPNGAGKTSAFNVLTGLLRPTAGTVWFQGRSLEGVSPSERARRGLGRSFQQGGLWLSETASANLVMAQYATEVGISFGDALSLTRAQARDDRRRAAVADGVLEVLGLAHVARQPVSTLPYGHRKLLEIGCALATRPTTLLLDEPAAGLPGSQRGWISEAIVALRRELGITVVIIEHDVPLVRAVSDRVYVLDFGHVIASGAPDDVLARPEVIEAYLGRPMSEITS